MNGIFGTDAAALFLLASGIDRGAAAVAIVLGVVIVLACMFADELGLRLPPKSDDDDDADGPSPRVWRWDGGEFFAKVVEGTGGMSSHISLFEGGAEHMGWRELGVFDVSIAGEFEPEDAAFQESAGETCQRLVNL